jgi:hypothetical protein
LAGQQIARCIATVGEKGFDPLGALPEISEVGALVVVLGREMPVHGAVRRGPRGQHLAHRKAPCEAVAAVEKYPLFGLDADRGVIVHAGAAERLQYLELQHDAAAAAVQIVRRTLVDVDVTPDRAQQQPGEKTAEQPACRQSLLRFPSEPPALFGRQRFGFGGTARRSASAITEAGLRPRNGNLADAQQRQSLITSRRDSASRRRTSHVPSPPSTTS